MKKTILGAVSALLLIGTTMAFAASPTAPAKGCCCKEKCECTSSSSCCCDCK